MKAGRLPFLHRPSTTWQKANSPTLRWQGFAFAPDEALLAKNLLASLEADVFR